MAKKQPNPIAAQSQNNGGDAGDSAPDIYGLLRSEGYKGSEHPSQIKIRSAKLNFSFRFSILWYEASLNTRSGLPRLHLGNVGFFEI